MPERLARHTLVWLSADADWQTDVAAYESRLAAWFARGLPAVVARRTASDPDPRLRLGVPLPPEEGKQRLSLRLPLQHLVCHQSPLSLRDVITRLDADLPDDWRDALTALDAIRPARVFGAFAWQALTGLAYVHARSDIDLLWAVDDAAQADALVARLLVWESKSGKRVDGELCLADGGAVHWREYAGATRQVLVKRIDGAMLEYRERLFAAQDVAA